MNCGKNLHRGVSYVVAVWMLLREAGSEGLIARCRHLLDRTERLCTRLNSLGIEYYRHPAMNHVAIRSTYIKEALAEKYLQQLDAESLILGREHMKSEHNLRKITKADR